MVAYYLLTGMILQASQALFKLIWTDYTDQLTYLAGKWTWIEDVFPIENADIPASYSMVVSGSPKRW